MEDMLRRPEIVAALEESLSQPALSDIRAVEIAGQKVYAHFLPGGFMAASNFVYLHCGPLVRCVELALDVTVDGIKELIAKSAAQLSQDAASKVYDCFSEKGWDGDALGKAADGSRLMGIPAGDWKKRPQQLLEDSAA